VVQYSVNKRFQKSKNGVNQSLTVENERRNCSDGYVVEEELSWTPGSGKNVLRGAWTTSEVTVTSAKVIPSGASAQVTAPHGDVKGAISRP
jgi:hypothetical protein